MTAAPPTTDWYAEACARARATGRRRRSRVESTEWPDLTPPVGLSDGPLGVIQAADREIARQTALRARAVADFAATRPATADRAQGEPGAMSRERWAARPEILRSVSEWAGRELMIALSISAESAEALLMHSLTLVHRLPGTLAALDAGALHPGHLWSMVEKVAPIEDDSVRAEVEAELLRWAAGRVTTPAQLGAKARREVLRRNARAAARRLEKALKERGVHLAPHAVDGMATVTVVASMPEAQALYRTLTACAESLDDAEEPRTRGEKMVDCLLDLVLRPGENDLPPVQVLLTVVASIATLAGGDDPGELDGQVVPAEMLRQFLSALTARGYGFFGDAGALTDQLASPIPWQQVEQEELENWWAETERRVLAGELADPADNPDHDLVEPVEMLVDVDAPEVSPAGTRRQPPRPAPTRDERVPDERPPDERGWWAAADRAVDDTSQALVEAGRKLAHAQRMVRTAVRADEADEAAWRAAPAGRVTDAEDAITALLAATDDQRQALADLLATTGGGGLADRPRIALTQALTGTLLALTDLPGLARAGTCGRAACRRAPERCGHDLDGRPGLGPPGPTDAYRPSAALDRWGRARDRRCRFPGCRRRVPKGGELDHHRPYPTGPTSAGNLVGYCTADHRGKHQAPGWRYRLDPDGTLTVTTPTGLVAATSPAPY